MKSIILSIICVLLLTIVLNGVGGDDFDDLLNDLNDMATNNESINGIFELSENGFLGRNRFSIVYKGILVPKPMAVAMKFNANRNESDNEYSMYTYLNAIDDPSVEVYGIPSIHYYGKWNSYFILAMTLFDPEFHQSLREQNYTQIDLLILFREFVRTTKYIHSRGVTHQDNDFTHIMFREQQGFIYDFSRATIHPKCLLKVKLCCARVDLQQFLSVMFNFIRESSNWIWLDYDCGVASFKTDKRNFAAKLKAESELKIKYTGLRLVFVEFAKYAYGSHETSQTRFYNRLYKVIVKEIENYAKEQKKPAVPSWLSKDERKDKAVLVSESSNPDNAEEQKKPAIPSGSSNDKQKDKAVVLPPPTIPSQSMSLIASIPELFESPNPEYKQVDYELFRNRYHSQPTSRGGRKTLKRLDCLRIS